MSNNSRATDFAEVLGEMNGGVLIQQLGQMLSDIALNVTSLTGKARPGEIVLTLSVSRIADSGQIVISHKVKSTLPTARGRVIEENTTETPFHVGPGGKVTLFPNTQTSLELGAGAATGRTDGVMTRGS